MRLDFGHVDERGAGLFGDDDAVTRGAGVVRRGEALEAGNVLRDEVVVAGEAARGVHHGLGVDLVGTVLALDDETRYGTLAVLRDFNGLRVHAHVDLTGLGGRVERTDDFRTHKGAARRTVRAGLRGAGHQAHVAEVAAERKKPIHGGAGIVHERADEFGIVLPVTALHRVGEHDFGAVLRALGLLKRRAAGVQTARGADGVAAGHRHLFNDDHLGAEVVSLNGGGKAGTAGADHDDVGRDVFSGGSDAEGGAKSGGKKQFLHSRFSQFEKKIVVGRARNVVSENSR